MLERLEKKITEDCQNSSIKESHLLREIRNLSKRGDT